MSPHQYRGVYGAFLRHRNNKITNGLSLLDFCNYIELKSSNKENKTLVD